MQFYKLLTDNPYTAFLIAVGLNSAIFPTPKIPESNLLDSFVYVFLDELVFRGLLFEVLPKDSIITVLAGTLGSCLLTQNTIPATWSFFIGLGRRNMTLQEVVLNKIMFVSILCLVSSAINKF
jgi:hypothetical protein